MEKNVIRSFITVTAAVFLAVTLSACSSATASPSATEKVITGITVEKPVPEPHEMSTFMPTPTMTGEGAPEGGMPGGMPGGDGGPPNFAGGANSTPAVYIDNGKFAKGKSKADLVLDGEFDDAYADGIKIDAKGGDLGGIYVSGLKSDYTINNANIVLDGDGPFGLAGPGSGASADNYATLTIRNSTITTSGENRNATANQNHSILKVYNSTLTANGAPFEPNYTDTAQKQQLEIDGNSRTHVTLSNSYSYFYYCDVIADGWAALSTDGAQGFVYLEANNCNVKTLKAGYGTYADMGCHVVINDSDFEVANMAGIMAGDADITFNRTTAKCGTYFALMHSIGGPEELSYLKVTDGEIECKSPVVLVKSANADLYFDGVKMVSESGILVKSTVSTDPQAANAADPKGKKVYGILATFRDMVVSGDIDHSEDKDNRNMLVYLEATELSGAVKDAYVSIDPKSKWYATGDSNVTLMGRFTMAQIDAPAGVTITAVAAESGTYTLASGGKLVLGAS
jgi:hypothetical protein